jgi:hypothetical protein
VPKQNRFLCIPERIFLKQNSAVLKQNSAGLKQNSVVLKQNSAGEQQKRQVHFTNPVAHLVRRS